MQPLAEWRQIFAEAWRLQFQHYWTPDLAGVDWDGIYQRYAPLVERITTQGENFKDALFHEMQGELGTSHAYEFGGDYRDPPYYSQGFLGANWRYDAEQNGYVITHIVTGDLWNHGATSPLRAPGTNVNVGDIFVAINSQHVSAEFGPQQLLVDQAGNDVMLLIKPADGGEPRVVSAQATSGEFSARYRDWVAGNRRYVHERLLGAFGISIYPIWRARFSRNSIAPSWLNMIIRV